MRDWQRLLRPKSDTTTRSVSGASDALQSDSLISASEEESRFSTARDEGRTVRLTDRTTSIGIGRVAGATVSHTRRILIPAGTPERWHFTEGRKFRKDGHAVEVGRLGSFG